MLPEAGRVAGGWRRRGLTGSLGYLRHRLSESYYERRLGIRTAGKVELPSVGIRDPRCKIYAPIAYRSFFALMKEVRVQPGKDVLVDLGAGKGRVVVLSALWAFRRIVGVEISDQLLAIAQSNVDRARRRLGPRLLCPEIQLIREDASRFAIPDQTTHLHLFDPFKEEILDGVLEEIRRTLERAPRPLTILYADPNHFDPLARARPWLRAEKDVPYPYREGSEPIRWLYRIYRAVPEVFTGLQT